MHMDTAATKKKNYCYCDKRVLIPRNLRIHLSIAAFTLHIIATFLRPMILDFFYFVTRSAYYVWQHMFPYLKCVETLLFQTFMEILEG